MMRTGLWHGLQALAEPTAVPADWRLLMGEDFAWVQRYLKPTRNVAPDHPCLGETDCGCRHVFQPTVKNQLQAVCRCGVGECPPVTLPLEEAFLHKLDVERFGATVARALRLSPVNGRAGLYAGPEVRLVGTYGAGHAPVYLALGVGEMELLQSLGNVAGRYGDPFILLGPTARARTEKVEALMQGERSVFIPLARCLGPNGDGELRQTAAIEGLLAPFRKGPGQKAVEGIVTMGRFRHSPGFEDVWVGDEHYDLRERKKARLCLRYLVEQSAFDTKSARHFTTEIDPYVLEHSDFPPAADIKIYHYFNDRTGRLPKLREDLIRPGDREGSFYLKTD